MKKKNLKSLALNKKSISNLEISGGKKDNESNGMSCLNFTKDPNCLTPTIFNSCRDVCYTNLCETEITCPSWWGGQTCA